MCQSNCHPCGCVMCDAQGGGLPFSHSASWYHALSDAHMLGHPCDVKENVARQTRPPSSITLWLLSDAHLPIVGALDDGRVSTDTLTGQQPCSPICNKLRLDFNYTYWLLFCLPLSEKSILGCLAWSYTL